MLEGIGGTRWNEMQWNTNASNLVRAASKALFVYVGKNHPFSADTDAMAIGVGPDVYHEGRNWYYMTCVDGRPAESWQREAFHILSDTDQEIDPDELFDTLITKYLYRGYRIGKHYGGGYHANPDSRLGARGVVVKTREAVCDAVDQHIADEELVRKIERGETHLEWVQPEERRIRIGRML